MMGPRCLERYASGTYRGYWGVTKQAFVHAVVMLLFRVLLAFYSMSTVLSSNFKPQNGTVDFVFFFAGLQTVGIFRVGSSKKRVRQVSEKRRLSCTFLDFQLNYLARSSSFCKCISEQLFWILPPIAG